MIERLYEQHLVRLLELFPVVAVIGPRQVGKSTLVQRPAIARSRTYVTLDDILARSLAEKDPVAVVDTASPLTIDEVQLVPDLLREIKLRVDRERTPGRFLITGSSDLNYMVDLSRVLAGRVGILRLPPITYFELNKRSIEPTWVSILRGESRDPGSAERPPFDWKHLSRGGFPLSVTARDPPSRSLWFDAFRSTYLERDLRMISDIAHLAEFSRVMELSAGRTAQILNQASIARDAGLSPVTAGRYLSILEASLLIRRIEPWYENIGKRLVKSPKLVWGDCGLAAHLLRIPPEQFPAHPQTGRLFETAVINEITALLPVYFPSDRIYFLRSHEGMEIDLLIQHGEHLVPLEIKSSRTITAADAEPIEKWLSLSGREENGMIIYAGTSLRRASRHVVAAPLT